MDLRDEFLSGKLVVHTGKEHAHEFGEWCRSQNIDFIHEDFLRAVYARYGEQACFRYRGDDIGVGYASLEYYQRERYRIVPVEELLKNFASAEVDPQALLSILKDVMSGE